MFSVDSSSASPIVELTSLRTFSISAGLIRPSSSPQPSASEFMSTSYTSTRPLITTQRTCMKLYLVLTLFVTSCASESKTAEQPKAATATSVAPPSAAQPTNSQPAAAQTSAAPAANPSPPPAGNAKLSPAELEKLVMPIALHPDPLIA